MADLLNTWSAGGYVRSIAVSPDGNHIAAGVDSAVIIWNMHTGQAVLGPLQKHRYTIGSIAFSPDGRKLASGSADSTWDARRGDTVFEPLTDHSAEVHSVTFSHNGRLLVSGSRDETIRLWSAHTGQTELTPIQVDSQVFSVVISDDGRIAFGGLEDGTIRAYDTATCRMIFKCVGHTGSVYSVALSVDGRRIASGSYDRTIRIWDAATGYAAGESLQGHTGYVYSVAFSSDGRYIASASVEGTIHMWDAETGFIQIGPLHEDTKQASAVVAFTPDGKCVASGLWDGTIMIWDVRSVGIRTQVLASGSPPPAYESLDIEITSTTTFEQILRILGSLGCDDLTDELDLATCSEYAISSGGFGDIFRAKLKNGTEVAIKTIRLYVGSGPQNPKYLKHAARELYAWSRYKHLNVQPLLGLAAFRGQIGMIATWESNGSLPEYIRGHPHADRCQLSIYVSEGLSYLHTSGVIHGDLKGGNILVSRNGIPQLADFGNAVLQEYTIKFTNTSTKNIMSTRWAAPEMFNGTACSMPADIYALGMTMLETITGNVPWGVMPELTIIYAVMRGTRPERPDELIPRESTQGDALWSLLESCWTFEPDKRPSAAEVKRVMNTISREGLRRY